MGFPPPFANKKIRRKNPARYWATTALIVAHKHVILGSDFFQNWLRGINHLRIEEETGFWAGTLHLIAQFFAPTSAELRATSN